MLLFTCGERETCSTIKKSQNIMNVIVCNFFSFCVYINNFIQNLLYLFKNLPRPNLKGFQYQIVTSVKRSGNQLSIKKNFSSVLQISCSSFDLKLCQRSYNYQDNHKIKFKWVWVELGARNRLQRQQFTKYLTETLVFM